MLILGSNSLYLSFFNIAIRTTAKRKDMKIKTAIDKIIERMNRTLAITLKNEKAI